MKLTLASSFGSWSKMFLSKIKIGSTFLEVLKASKRPLLSSKRKSRLNQKIVIWSVVMKWIYILRKVRLICFCDIRIFHQVWV